MRGAMRQGMRWGRTRRLFLGPLVAGPAGLLAACGAGGAGGSGGAESGPGAAARPPATVSYWTRGNADVERIPLEEDLTRSFAPAHPHITLERGAAAWDKMLVAFAGGNTPDVYLAGNDQVRFMHKNGLIQDLKPRAARDRAFRAEEYLPRALTFYEEEGRVLAYPSTQSIWHVYYNAAHFRAAALPTPYELHKQGRWTWDAYEDAARKLTRYGPDGKATQIGVTWGDEHYRQAVWSNGGSDFDHWARPKALLLDKPEAQEALQLLVDLRWRHKAEFGHPDLKPQGMTDRQAFGAGLLSLLTTSGVGLGYGWPPDLAYGYVPFPKGRGPKAKHAAEYGSSGHTLFRASKAPDAAWELTRWWTRERVRWMLDTKTLTSLPARAPFVEESNALWPGEHPEMFAESARVGHEQLCSVDRDQIWNQVKPALKPMWDGQESVKSATSIAAQTMGEWFRAHPQ